MKDSFLKIIIIIIQIHVTIAVAENKYEIDLSTLNEHIESFKLIDNNSAIILGTSIFGNNWEVIGGRAIKIEIPKCNVIWYKEFNLKTGIRNIESSPEYTFIKLTAYPEYSASTTIIVDSIGKTVSQFKQKKIFLLNDQLLLSSVDPEYALGEYSTNVNSKFFIRKIIDNTVVHEMDLGGEVIDARLDDDTIRLIIATDEYQKIYQFQLWSPDKILLLGEISESVAKEDQISFFLNDSIVINYRIAGNPIIKENIISNNKIRSHSVPIEHMENFQDKTNTFQFKTFNSGIAYILELRQHQVIGIPFVEDNNPKSLYELCGDYSDKIELNHSAFFKVDEKRYMLNIPTMSSKVLISVLE